MAFCIWWPKGTKKKIVPAWNSLWIILNNRFMNFGKSRCCGAFQTQSLQLISLQLTTEQFIFINPIYRSEEKCVLLIPGWTAPLKHKSFRKSASGVLFFPSWCGFYDIYQLPSLRAEYWCHITLSCRLITSYWSVSSLLWLETVWRHHSLDWCHHGLRLSLWWQLVKPGSLHPATVALQSCDGKVVLLIYKSSYSIIHCLHVFVSPGLCWEGFVWRDQNRNNRCSLV